MSVSPLVILGCGYAGRAVALRAMREGRGVIGTVRTQDAADRLGSDGIDARVVAALTPDSIRSIVIPGCDLLVSFPPDGHTDATLASQPSGAARIVYVSSTAVYGDRHGTVDESTPVSPDSPRAIQRLEAERAWRACGAIALRVAAIYGPGRGIHRRIANGTFRIPGNGANVVSRIHVDDLASLILAAFERGEPGSVYLAADDAPVPQIEAVRFVCDRLGCPLPPSVPPEAVSETLRHDRSVSNRRARVDLGWFPEYPSYREGFPHAMAGRDAANADPPVH